MVSALRLSQGTKIEVTFTSAVEDGDLAYADGWLGFVPRDKASGEKANLDIEDAQYDIVLPTALGLSKGDEVFVDITDLTGHIPDDSAYATSSGANTVKLGRCVIDQDGTSGRVIIQSTLRSQ